MPSPEDIEDIKKLALKATALVAGGILVKQLYDQGRQKGYIFYNESTGNTFIGLLKDSGGIAAQLTGRIISRGKSRLFEADDLDITGEQIAQLNELVSAESDNEV